MIIKQNSEITMQIQTLGFKKYYGQHMILAYASNGIKISICSAIN
jgi:hypothetical protein